MRRGDVGQGSRELPVTCSKPKRWRKVLELKDLSSPCGSAVPGSRVGPLLLTGAFTVMKSHATCWGVDL